MNTLTLASLQTAFGLTPANRYSRYVLPALIGTAVLMVLLLGLLFVIPLGLRIGVLVAFGAVGIVGPLIVILTIYLARGQARTQRDLAAGPHWLHWDYSPEELRRYAPLLTAEQDQIYVGPYGLIWRRHGDYVSASFSDGLTGVEMVPGDPAILKFKYTRSRTDKTDPLSRTYTINETTEIPIPAGREDEVLALFKDGRAARIGETMNRSDIQIAVIAIVVVIVIVAVLTVLLFQPCCVARPNALS